MSSGTTTTGIDHEGLCWEQPRRGQLFCHLTRWRKESTHFHR